MKLKILIVEDKQDDIDSLRRYLEKNHGDEITISAIATNYDEALKILSKNVSYNLSILDVGLPETRSSFDLVRAFDKEKFGTVAFLTETPNIPVDVIEKVDPIAFKKPFNDAKIANLIYKARKKEGLTSKGLEIPIVEEGHLRKAYITVAEIYYIVSVEGEPRHSFFHFLDKKQNAPNFYESTMSIADFEKIPKEDVFIKARKDCIVNASHIDKLEPSTTEILFDNSFTNIPYSQTFYHSLRKKIMETR